MAVMDEAHDEAVAALAVDLPAADLSVPETADIALGVEAGIWFGMLGLLTVLERHGIIPPMPKDGEARE
jgi:hypothetical protein